MATLVGQVFSGYDTLPIDASEDTARAERALELRDADPDMIPDQITPAIFRARKDRAIRHVLLTGISSV